MAKYLGIFAAIAIFALWFYLIGTRPVLETVIGLALAVGGGLWTWRAVGKWLARRQDDPP